MNRQLAEAVKLRSRKLEKKFTMPALQNLMSVHGLKL
jgi:hypothetical protein